jgi:membrane fusion protein (multidrug efflux system)
MRASCLLCAVAFLAACHSSENEKEAAAPLPRVRVEPARKGPVDETVGLTGLLTAPPGRDVKLGALVPGRLARVRVAEGDAVKAGQVLAEIETGPSVDELSQAQATAAEAAAAEAAAVARRARTEALVQKGIASTQEAEQARADTVAAASARERARAAVDLAQRKLSRSALVAPFDGWVVAVLVREGESVDGNGQPVVEVAAPDPVEVRCAVPPRVAARLKVGVSAKVTVEALGLSRDATVFAVAPAADAQSGNVTVRLRLPNPDRALKLGTLARAQVGVSHRDAAVEVASSALVPEADGGLAVQVVEGSVVHPTPVGVDFEVGPRTVISSGLDGGEEVVVEGGYALPEGTRVEVVR